MSPNWPLGFESIWASSRPSAARTIDRFLAEILMEMPERMGAELALWDVNCSTHGSVWRCRMPRVTVLPVEVPMPLHSVYAGEAQSTRALLPTKWCLLPSVRALCVPCLWRT